MKFVLVLSILLCTAPVLLAQEAPRVGNVEGISYNKVDTLSATRFARLSSTPRMVRNEPVSRQDPLFVTDLLQLTEPNVFLDLRFIGKNTRLISGTCDMDCVKINRTGRYLIDTTSVTSVDPFRFALLQGSMAIQHSGGTFQAAVVNHLIDIFGTTVFLHVENDSTGYLYLEEGSLSFVNFQNVAVPANSLWLLESRLGVPIQPQQLLVPGRELRRWRNDTQYFTNTVWQPIRPPLWKRPVFYVPAAIAVGGLVAILLTNNDGDDTRTGRITITLPD